MLLPYAKRSVAIFLTGVAAICVFGVFEGLRPTVAAEGGGVEPMSVTPLIQMFMLSAAALILLLAHVQASDVASTPIFKSGMVAMIALFGIAWMADTFIANNEDAIVSALGSLAENWPFTIAIAIFLVAALTTSQSAATRTMIPLGLALGIGAGYMIAMWTAVAGVIFLPANGTQIAAAEADETGTTTLGKRVIDHSFQLPLQIAGSSPCSRAARSSTSSSATTRPCRRCRRRRDVVSAVPAQAMESGRAAAGGVLAAACVSTFVVNANTSAVTILLPTMSEDTGAPVAQLQWAVTGYMLVGAAVIVTSGALGDVFGRRRVFLGGLALFIASCVLIALSTSGAGIIVGRLIQGAAGSTILACGMSLLSVASSGKGQMRAITLWGAASAAGAAMGPLIGGALVELSGWQTLFWLDGAIAAACIPLTLAKVQESRDPQRSR